jgi:hypothetical protein
MTLLVLLKSRHRNYPHERHTIQGLQHGPGQARTRDLAMFNLAIDSKLRGCDVMGAKGRGPCTQRICSRSGENAQSKRVKMRPVFYVGLRKLSGRKLIQHGEASLLHG